MKIDIGTKVRTAALFVALINQVLVALGHSPIPWNSEAVELVVSTGVTGVTALWAWWKNNSFTKKAIKADEFKKNLL